MNPRSVSDIENGCITFIAEGRSIGKFGLHATDDFLRLFLKAYDKKKITDITIVTTERIALLLGMEDIHPKLIITNDPKLEFAKILNKHYTHFGTEMHPTVRMVGKNIEIGLNVKLHPNVVIYDDTVVGDNTIIYANSTIGCQDLNPVWGGEEYVMLYHTGRVIIGKDVVIGCNNSITRGTLSDTVIGDGCKFSPCVSIGHGARLGKNVVVTAGVVLAGSVTIGDNSWIGPGAVVRDNITIGKNVLVGLGCIVVKDVPDNVTIYRKSKLITRKR